MQTVRTPDDRFADLPDYPFEPHYAKVPDGDGGTLRVHYLDEGPADAAPILLLHGEPSWSYLYRFMIPPLVAAGHRVIVPDQVGFGRSDKPTEQSDYTYARHVAWMSALVFDHLDLTDCTFFGQDWGGLIGLRLVAAQPERFARVAVGNTGLPTGDQQPSEAFLRWQQFSQTTPTFDVGFLINAASVRDLDPAEVAAYDAPFPDDSYKAGARTWPALVVTSPDDPEAGPNKEAWEVLRSFDKPFLCCFSDSDLVTAGGDKPFRTLIAGAQGQSHRTIEGGGHFFQEDCGPELAQLLNDFIAATL
ncbi:MAG: haloalkane dehalogenase [Ilumatobacter fluminis]|uniref:haloalkane dehalogenase n=1 Tax=Ilumatobacter fluminis TaxID=467091 RepID=UPI0032EE7C02